MYRHLIITDSVASENTINCFIVKYIYNMMYDVSTMGVIIDE